MTREEPRSFKNSMTGVTTKHFVKMILPSRTGIRLRNTATELLSDGGDRPRTNTFQTAKGQVFRRLHFCVLRSTLGVLRSFPRNFRVNFSPEFFALRSICRRVYNVPNDGMRRCCWMAVSRPHANESRLADKKRENRRTRREPNPID